MDTEGLDPAELAYLLQRLEESVAETPGRMRRRSLAMVGLCVAGAGLAAISQAWVPLGIAAVLGTFSATAGAKATRRASPDHTRPVVDAVRDAPERITSVRHHRPQFAPVEHWLAIETAGHRLTVDAKDWQRLYSALQRRCPAASFVDD